MESRLKLRSTQRMLLRAGNGAAVGSLLGLVIGAVLLPGFCFFAPGTDLPGLAACAVLGGFLGACGGLLISMTIVIPDDRRRRVQFPKGAA
jgi:hypothetical protein